MAPPTSQEALQKCKKLVYLYRLQLKPLFQDFDQLRKGKIFENQFLSALSQSGLHKFLSVQHLQLLADAFKSKDFQGNKGDVLFKVDYKAFLNEVEKVFGEKGLEKDPLKVVAPEPAELLDRLRYQRTTRQLTPAKEIRVQEVLEPLIRDCKIKGIQVKHAFDDAAQAPKLSKIVNHVTTSQFFQGLCKLNLGISASDGSLLAEKFAHEELPDLVNYALFSRVANPTSLSLPNSSTASAIGGPLATSTAPTSAPVTASASELNGKS